MMMDVLSDPILDLAQTRLDWLQSRQSVLAQNVANSDTPGYRPSDMVPFSSILSGAVLSPVATNPMHITGVCNTSGIVATAGTERAPDGNQVSLDTELTKVADTENQQRLVSNIYSKYMSMFSLALGRG